jgi:predicted PurR-regulated permease PerM
MLAATVLTVLLLWLGGKASHVFLLLFLSILLSLYLGAVADFFVRRTRLPRQWAFLLAVLISVSGLVGLIALLVPPIVEQTQQLVRVLPATIAGWERAIDRFVTRFPTLQEVWQPGQGQVMRAIYGQVSGTLTNLVPKVVGIGHGFISVFSVLIMSIYLGLHPALYREFLIALFPPLHRDLVRDVLAELGDTLRAWITGQLFAMFVLAVFTAIGLWWLDVPYWLTFSVFTGVVAIVPFFGTLVSTILPALFVLGQPGGEWRAFLVVIWGVVVHLVEGNFVVPRVMAHKVDLPPVLTIMSVLIMGSLMGGAGLLVAVPMVAILMVVVRRILISRLYEGHGFRKTMRDNALVLRVPVPESGVMLPETSTIDILSVIEARTSKKPA